MSDTERHRGRWLLAGQAAESVAGVLIIDEDGRLSLELSGALGRGPSQGDPATEALMRGHHRIVGELENFSAVSLNGMLPAKHATLLAGAGTDLARP